MTLEELQKLSDQDLVPLCATVVMGWKFSLGEWGSLTTNEMHDATWNPLTNWNDTMQVVYCLKSRGEQVVLDFYNRADGDLCEIAKPSDRGSTGVSCDDMQRAIVIASILATQS